MTTTTCDRCGYTLGDDEEALGWPVPVTPEGGDPTQDVEMICPDCYGPKAYCSEGHVLRGDTDSSHCAVCEEEETTTYEIVAVHPATEPIGRRTVVAIDEHGERHDLNAAGEPIRSYRDLTRFVAELRRQGCYGATVEAALLREAGTLDYDGE